jgi:hypothetical protein
MPANHAGDYVVAAQHLPVDLCDCQPGGAGQSAEQAAVVAAVDPQAFGDGEDELPVGNGRADGVGDTVSGQQGPLLVATWAEATLTTGEGDEHFVTAVGAADAGKAQMGIAAAEQSAGNLADDRPPRSVTPRVTAGIDPLELGQIALDGTIQRRVARPARAIDGRLCCSADHGEAASPCHAR